MKPDHKQRVDKYNRKYKNGVIQVIGTILLFFFINYFITDDPPFFSMDMFWNVCIYFSDVYIIMMGLIWTIRTKYCYDKYAYFNSLSDDLWLQELEKEAKQRQDIIDGAKVIGEGIAKGVVKGLVRSILPF